MHNKFIIGISGVVLNKQNQVLLLRHRYWKEGSWGLPSGYAKRGEKLEDTLSREVHEETGHIVKTRSFLKMTSGYKLRLEVSYIGDVVGGELKMDRREVLEAKFFSLDELPPSLLESHRDIIHLAFSKKIK